MAKTPESIKKYYEAKEFYINNEVSLDEMEKKFHLCAKSFKKFLLEENVDIDAIKNSRKELRHKYQLDLDKEYFKNINTEIKAYMLGFILADGNIDKDERRLKIAISIIDKNILEIFLEDCNYKGEIHAYQNKSKSNYNSHQMIEVSIFGVDFVSYLIDKNLHPNKSTNEIPYYKINDVLISHYIRGIFDGDGWINYTPSSHSREFGICSSIEVCNFIYDMFYRLLNIEGKISKNNNKKDNNLYRIRYFRKNEINKIFNFIYNDSTIFLDRKYLKMKSLLPS